MGVAQLGTPGASAQLVIRTSASLAHAKPANTNSFGAEGDNPPLDKSAQSKGVTTPPGGIAKFSTPSALDRKLTQRGHRAPCAGVGNVHTLVNMTTPAVEAIYSPPQNTF